MNRIKLLSTTHFGLATPVLNIQRETAANALADKLIKSSVNKEGKLTVYNTSGSLLQCVQLASDGKAPVIEADGLESYTVVPMGDDSVFVMLKFNEIKDKYELRTHSGEWNTTESKSYLKSGKTELVFNLNNPIDSFIINGKVIGAENFISSYLTYDNKWYEFQFERLTGGRINGGECLELKGSINLPKAVSSGEFCYRFFTSDTAEGIFVVIDIKYPYTSERDSISTENSTLGRYTDMKWQEAVPFGISFGHNERELSVIKRNFEGDISSFRVASYGEADERNKTLDSFNNQLTAGCIGLSDGDTGILIANARNVLSSMAYCPMRLYRTDYVMMNPFGTFFGAQRHHPNRSDDRIPLTYTLIAPQGKSLAPSYNGSCERAVLCLKPFEGNMPDENSLKELLAFADGAYVTGSDETLSVFEGDNVIVHNVVNKLENAKIHSPLLSGIKGNLGKYIVRGIRAISYIIRRQRKAK